MAAAAPIVAIVACTIALLGLLGAYAGFLAPMTGFMMFVAGTILGGLASVLVGGITIFLGRRDPEPGNRRKGLVSLAAGLVLWLVVFGAASTGGDAPPINDITTDLANPPSFADTGRVPAYAGRDMSYPAEYVEIVRESYPDLAPIQLDLPAPEAFAQATATAEALGWTIVASDARAGVFDAYDETTLFRFVDDVTVRIVAEGDGARIDVRSKSRDGQGDLGANAARIRAFIEVMR